jgi:phosphoglycerol transferase MdoB-like AlkP superfamily enzyme
VKRPESGWLRLIPILIGVPAIALLGIQLVCYPIFDRLNAYGYTPGCSHYGIVPTYAVMLGNFLPRKTRTVPFPFERTESTSSPFSGTLRGSNVLIVQVESLDADLLGRRIGEKPVMPFLEQLATENAYFPQCIAMHTGGGSSDAELAAILSLLPLTTGSGLATADWSRVTPLPHILNGAGYTCVGLHSNRGSFYERIRRYAKMGFADFHDQKRFSGDAAGWNSKDGAFFKQSVEKLKSVPKPFFGYAITLQSHSPFRNYRAETKAEFGTALAEFSDAEKDYLIFFRQVNQALAGV